MQFARIGTDGVLHEFPFNAASLDGVATPADCRQWFAGRSNYGKLIVGSFAFVRTTRWPHRK